MPSTFKEGCRRGEAGGASKASEPAVAVKSVWKKFRRGELHDSLRDLIPAVGRWMLGRHDSTDVLQESEFWALQDVSFEVRRGEAVGIIGPNGAGKSTLLKILSKILRPNQGVYRVEGRLRALIEVGAGFHTDLTGRENIYLNGSIQGMRKVEIDRRLDEIVAFSGIESFLDTPVKRYSSGMQARLGFSIAAHMDPEVLLVDEVLSVGDAAFRAKCLDHMERLIASDVSVVFISHNLEQVRRLCDRAVVLEKGRVKFDGDVATACDAYYGCFDQEHGRSMLPQGVDAGPARLLRLRVTNEEGGPTRRVAAHRPLVVEVTYQLAEARENVAIVVRFLTANGRILTGCSTIRGESSLPGRVGTHTVLLHVEGLPFSAGDYLVTGQLVDRDGTLLDSDLPPYPLGVSGDPTYHWDVTLEHEWYAT